MHRIRVTALSPAVSFSLGADGPPPGFRYVYSSHAEPLLVPFWMAKRLEVGKDYDVKIATCWIRIPPYKLIERIFQAVD